MFDTLKEKLILHAPRLIVFAIVSGIGFGIALALTGDVSAHTRGR